MISVDEDALICDFAEYYHIFDYRSLEVHLASILAYGLPDFSRIKRKLTGQKHSNDTLLMALIVDDLNLMLWQRTKDGQNNRNRPKSVYQALIGKAEEKDEAIKGFKSADDFEKARAEILARKGEKNG